MPLTMQFTGTLTIETCCTCHITFAMPEDLRERALKDHDIWFFCPLGHRQHFTGETEEQKLARQLRAARSDATWYADQYSASQRSKAAIRGHLTRMRNRVANGLCPVAGCRRHFDNVENHLRGVHADWLAEHDAVLDRS